eukprot:991703-Rhodomonas_salina.1
MRPSLCLYDHQARSPFPRNQPSFDSDSAAGSHWHAAPRVILTVSPHNISIYTSTYFSMLASLCACPCNSPRAAV